MSPICFAICVFSSISYNATIIDAHSQFISLKYKKIKITNQSSFNTNSVSKYVVKFKTMKITY